MVRFILPLAAFILAAALPAQAASPPVTLLVNPLIGTSMTHDGSDVIDDFPGADVPFGMVQWSPDTPARNAGGGYEYAEHEITGFSLTHLSGPGCSVFGDFGILPTIGTIVDPATAQQPFSHTNEIAAPGSYTVTLGQPAIRADLTVTKRTGLGTLTFPQTAQANVLFNVASNQAGVRTAGFHVVGPSEVAGFAQTGGFCGMPDRYTVYFVARFDRPFASFGTWSGKTVAPNTRTIAGARTGGWVTFDTTHHRMVSIKVGLSFVDEDGARANLDAENPDWDLVRVRNAATAQWQQMLERIHIDGGTEAEERIFYTAFYHALLHPNVYSDVTGRYRGFDGAIHTVRPGHAEYANFSDWDIYRTEIPLLALVAPQETSDMMESLVDAAAQDVFLPRWALVNGATSVMGGDSVDPVIAGAYAFGARDFDVHAALGAMIKGATDTTLAPADGWYVERPELAEYLQRGYIVNTHTTSVSPVPNGASETLEYALDDFSIGRFAQDIGEPQTAQTFLRRSANWANLFDTATGLIAPRDADGAFLNTPITENGQSGFQEGNAAQYTWMVPQDLHDLIAGMGGDSAAVAKLDRFFSKLNAGQAEPYAWLGNEPSLGSPWVYLSAGAPWRTQELVRRSILTMYDESSQGLPGNDDLGTMSAWYIWSAIGLYPQNPAVRTLVIGSPLFPHVTITSPGGPTIDLRAPEAADGTPYVHGLFVDGVATTKTWIDLPQTGTLQLDFALGSTADKRWGSASADAPPSYAAGAVSFPAATTAQLVPADEPSAPLPDGSQLLRFTIANAAAATAPVTVSWRAILPPGFTLERDSGTVIVPPGGTTKESITLTTARNTMHGLYAISIAANAANGATLGHLTIPVRVATPAEVLPLGFIENRFDDTVTPFDPRTNASGPAIATGTEPRDAVLSRDGTRLYVCDRGAHAATVIDTSGRTAAHTVNVGKAPGGIAIAPDGKTLWVANADDDTIQAIDTASLVAAKPIAVGINPRAIAIAPDGAALYVTNNGDNTVTPVDPRTGAVSPAIAVGEHPAGIAITPDGKTAFVVDSGSNDVTPIDLGTRTSLPAIPAGVYPLMIAIAPDGKVAYVTDYASITITPIDIASRTARAPIVVGGAPYGVAFTRDGATAYVALRRDNAFVPVDVASGRAGVPISLGPRTSPYTIALP